MGRCKQKDRERKRAAEGCASMFNFVSKKPRVPALSATASSLLGLVPSVICNRHLDTTEIVSMYAEDLPSPELVDQEITRWKLKYGRVPGSQRPNTPAGSIKECDRDLYPNLHVLLQLACTLPVTSCECERSASALRRLNSYMRASMGKERLSSLALLHIHYSKHIDLDRVVDVFANKHSRRMELDSLVYPEI
ncbi:52 kDa repressor of the inhibitor of the protein kinase-like [Nematolebias whitei]|uniref:52 kDa repressor of the inhibitor of the protein kinase-like n=1 Tax=Nematolebias whitei TaxID=451745 RepID=UPI0018985ABC|nr:52 kDa repressor of the inhibitor of the protein kinase-like [Nematolebias whitei]XP_037553082.1 52 kDa repressor of the inhibitor of the protein kinase-like [Nematolebias whitei]